MDMCELIEEHNSDNDEFSITHLTFLLIIIC